MSEGTGGEGLTVPSDADAHGFGYAGASHDPGWLSDTSGAPLDAFMPEWGFGDSFEQPHNEIDTSTTLPLWPGPQLVADCPHWDRSFIFPYLPATDHPWNASQIHSFDRYDMQTFHLPSTSTVASPLPKHSCAELPPLPSEDAPLSEQAFESPSSGTSMYSQSDCDTSSPEGLPSAESEETPVPPMLSRRSPPSSASLSPEPPQTALRSEQDRVLVSLRKKGLPYKEIMKQHDFGGVTESTLRGRYRARTKSAAERPRQPIWTCKDVSLRNATPFPPPKLSQPRMNTRRLRRVSAPRPM